ncbi:MAG: carboxymuconolactone decarboxylase family protein [Candidatus Didemnitutus sp.]|nr:carboxymuconolactone decarboxylase family protein [Candidatus Didemnitutus sp.]
MKSTDSSTTSPAAAPRVNYRQVAPAAVAAMLVVQRAVNESGLEHSLLELVKLRASQINGCAYCLDLHWRDAKKAGETDERLYLLGTWEESPGYTERERAALRWTEALTRLSSGHVSDATFAAARAHFTEPELVQLTLAIVVINGWNRFSVGFKVPPRAEF